MVQKVAIQNGAADKRVRYKMVPKIVRYVQFFSLIFSSVILVQLSYNSVFIVLVYLCRYIVPAGQLLGRLLGKWQMKRILRAAKEKRYSLMLQDTYIRV